MLRAAWVLKFVLLELGVVTVILEYFKQIVVHFFRGGEPNTPICMSMLLSGK